MTNSFFTGRNYFKHCSLFFVSVLFFTSSCSKKNITLETPQYVKTCIAESVGAESKVSYPGKLKASEVVNSSFKQAGTISRIYVNEGDYVRKGQLIGELDSHDYEVQLTATEAEYAQVKADAERIMSMYEEGTATASTYDKARYGLEQISKKLAHHRDQIAYCKLYAPISGYIQTKIHDAGENVSAGLPILSIFTSSDLEVEIFIPASDYTRRSEMLYAQCVFDIFPDQAFGLEVARLSKEANASQLYMARLRFIKGVDTSSFTPGMTTMVNIGYQKGDTSGHTKIPTSCLLSNQGKQLVYVLDKSSNRVSPRVVTTGALDSRGNIEITAGLLPGETVVSAGVRYLKAGQEVREADKTSSANVGKLL